MAAANSCAVVHVLLCLGGVLGIKSQLSITPEWESQPWTDADTTISSSSTSSYSLADELAKAVYIEVQCDKKFIRPDHPFILSCPLRSPAEWIVPDNLSKEKHRYFVENGLLHVLYAFRGERFRCKDTSHIYCYEIDYVECNSSICKGFGKCVEIDDGTGIPHYECRCPYKTRGIDCDEKYHGIEWLIAILWVVVFGEVFLMVTAICRHRHQRIYRGIVNKKRFVDVLNDSKKNA